MLAVAAFGQRTSAQTLTSSLFERYLESLREQAGIPGMSALVLQGGVVTWEQGFGRADLETGERAEPYTPYLIGDMSQIFGATLLLRKCLEENIATLNDPIAAWVQGSTEPATIVQLAAHLTPTHGFAYDRARFAALTPVIEACARGVPYTQLLDDLFVRRSMLDSAAGTRIPPAAERETLNNSRLDYHAAVLRRLGTPYALDRGRPVRMILPPAGVDAAFGAVSSVRDLAKFDRDLGFGPADDLLITPANRQYAWTRVVPHLPSGFGWFVQSYNGTKIVWQFGVVHDAYSSLIVKVPERGLTFILLANSDRLSTPFALEQGDVTASVFARLFLRIYVR